MVVILFLVFHFVLFLDVIASARMCSTSNESAFWVFDFDPNEFCGFYCATMHIWVHFYARFSDSKCSRLRRVLIKLWQKMIIRTEVIKSGKQKYASSSCELLVEIHNLTSLLIVLTHCSHSLLTRTMYIRCLVSLSVKWAQACALGSRNFSSLFTKQQQTF